MNLTWLYVPGDRPERFDKAVASGADVVIIDLEDAVAPSRKEEARRHVRAYLRGGAPAVHVRINDPATDQGRLDLRALEGIPLAGVRVPKVDSPAAVDLVDLDAPVHALLESAAGVVNAMAIAAHPRVAGVALGEQDLIAQLSITDEGALDQLRVGAVLAAAAAGLPPVPMSVYANVADDAGLLASTRRGRGLGLFGRTAIHPRQLPVIREAFRPSEEEVAGARQVVAAAEAAGDVGAVALRDGRFVDAPVIARARRTLALADRLSS
ncbi:HpcH/HpaI aldolase/citrate lyase family protein [Nonomuraea africana]|uniref:Citrate lyase subunit beta/citryl-CoA lyase n=1 Tax=Nonomuraea africana TaxID=46171 RepID=A0ABR9KEG2_9ACTN|nr:CoA ester lyase [Nonomuraea africana]MBE1560389.1 citrate lyase subunit beta/citryl-CoA lyase [Nonomuraea africana]